jgi:hypothetical protein
MQSKTVEIRFEGNVVSGYLIQIVRFNENYGWFIQDSLAYQEQFRTLTPFLRTAGVLNEYEFAGYPVVYDTYIEYRREQVFSLH